MPLTNLTPTFYRVAGRVRSGWINKAGEFCDTEEGNQLAIRVVPNAEKAFKVGQRLEFNEALDLYPYAFVTAGERGHVAMVDDESGVVDLMLEGVHMGLDKNTLTLVPFHDEEIIERLQFYKRPVFSLDWMRRALRVLSRALSALDRHSEGYKLI